MLTQNKTICVVFKISLCLLPLLLQQVSFASSIKGSTSRIEPFSIVNTSPIILIHGRPAASNATITKQDNLEVNFIYEVTSHFNQEQSSKETIIMDGETTRLELAFKKGINQSSDIELRIPYYKHEGGSLDSFIDDWHGFFGLPDNDRDKVPRDRLLFFYQYKGETRLNLQESESGIGDVQLTLSTQLGKHFQSIDNLSLKTALKLPTGDADKLTGSDAWSLSAWLAGDSTTTWFDFPGLVFGSLGGMYLQEGDVIAEQQNNFVVFGGIGSGAVMNDYITLQLQLDVSSPFYSDSDYADINGYTMQLTMGGNLRFNPGWSMDIAVVEDIRVHASPDVIFHLGMKGKF